MHNIRIPLFKVAMDKDVTTSLGEVLHSGYIGQGPKVEEFEKRLSEYLGVKYINCVNSATSGLHLAVHMLKQNSGGRDEILTTPLTCAATNTSIDVNGFKIKWVDVDRDTCNMDLSDLRRKIGPNTRAIVAVHWAGNPVNLNELESIRRECLIRWGRSVDVIEDCAHAIGSMFNGKMIGSHGNTCVFSFQAIKHLTTGDGGAVVSRSAYDYHRTRLLRWYGMDRSSSNRNMHECGFKFHMNDIAATIGLANLAHLPSIVEKHHQNDKWLRSSLPNVKFASVNESMSYSSCWVSTIMIEDRENFIRKMAEHGIETSHVHSRNDLLSSFRSFRTELPNMDHVSGRMCCIPCGWWLTEEDKQHIVASINSGW